MLEETEELSIRIQSHTSSCPQASVSDTWKLCVAVFHFLTYLWLLSDLCHCHLLWPKPFYLSHLAGPHSVHQSPPHPHPVHSGKLTAGLAFVGVSVPVFLTTLCKRLNQCWPREHHEFSWKGQLVFRDTFSHDELFQLRSYWPKLRATRCFGLYSTNALLFESFFVLSVQFTVRGVS